MRIRIATLIIALASALMVACEEPGREVDVIEIPSGDPDTIYFPRREKSAKVDSADVTGTIHLVDRCLRVVEEPNTDHLIIWPHDWELRARNDEIAVLNSMDIPVAWVGDRVLLGGDWVADSLDDEIRGCSGPFWNATGVFDPVD